MGSLADDCGVIQMAGKNMEDNNLSEATIKKVKTILTPVFKEALSDDVITKNILEQISIHQTE